MIQLTHFIIINQLTNTAVTRASGHQATSKYLAHLAATTNASPFSGGISSGHIDLGDDGFLPVSLCVIPREASRHNCATRPDAIAKLLKGPLGNVKSIEGLPVPPEPRFGAANSADDDGANHRGFKRARVSPTAMLVVLLPNNAGQDCESQCTSVAAAIARAAPPMFSRKTGGSRADSATVEVRFFVDGDP